MRFLNKCPIVYVSNNEWNSLLNSLVSVTSDCVERKRKKAQCLRIIDL